MEEDEHKTVLRNVTGAAAATGAEPKACLLVIAGGTVGAMHTLPERGEVFIGRAADVAIHIDDEGVSRRHARLSITPDRIVVADLASTNGTYVNGAKIEEQTLRDGDKLQIGPQTVLKLQYQDALEENYQRKLFDSAVKDGLTGIYNKKYFLDRLETEYAYARRHQTPLTLLLFDIDHFKNINDGYGHPTGDCVLQELARLVQRAVRREDVFARFGGEEFVILMRDVDDEKALMLAERIRQLVQYAVFEFSGKRIPLTVSIGIGTWSAGQEPLANGAELVNRADQYLYRAKNGGRNRVAGRALKG